MEEKTITAVAKVLSDWNPLGPAAKTYADLNDYRTEATNIIFELQIRSSRRYAERIVMEASALTEPDPLMLAGTDPGSAQL